MNERSKIELSYDMTDEKKRRIEQLRQEAKEEVARLEKFRRRGIKPLRSRKMAEFMKLMMEEELEKAEEKEKAEEESEEGVSAN